MKTIVEISDKINYLIDLLDYWKIEAKRTSVDDGGYHSYCLESIMEIEGRIDELKWVTN